MGNKGANPIISFEVKKDTVKTIHDPQEKILKKNGILILVLLIDGKKLSSDEREMRNPLSSP